MRASFFIAAYFLFAHAANAAVCAPPDFYLKKLSDKFNESVAFHGVDGAKNSVVITRNRGGAWTLLYLKKDLNGNIVACLINAGDRSDLYPGEAT